VKLTVGILRHDLAWERLLTQIGASWTVVTSARSLAPDAYSVIVVNAEPDQEESGALRDYMHDGGALLGDFGRLHSVFSVPVVRKRYTYLAPGTFAQFAPSSIVDLYAAGRILTGLSIWPEASMIQLFTAGSGFAASIPFDCSALIRRTDFKRKNFYAPTEHLPSEYVSTVSKGQIREIVTTVLEYLHHARNLPFVHLWYYPDGQPSVFTFRVDTDQGSKSELSELHATCARHRVKGTWFADVKSHEGWLDFFGTFNAQEIGLHCYEHRTDSAVRAVRANFSKGARRLREAGFAVHGATAPCGTWNEAVDAVYRELDIAYSSEFSLGYDDLPFLPIVDAGGGEETSSVMQLPIHPICVGSMRNAAFSTAQMSEYFRTWIDNRLASRQPVCLYHHPTHHHWDVFDDAFSHIEKSGIPCMTYSEYAAWWKKRTACVPEISMEHGTITAQAEEGIFYRIAFPGNEEALTPIDGSVDTNTIARTKTPAPVAPATDLARARRFDPRHPILNLLDRWYKLRTP
jgi:hypothetical protein